MPNKLFGVADPQYDALRVFSQQALESNPGIGAGGLENKIYLWPADGSPIATYAPTRAGLIAALTAAAVIVNSTVWLPSIPISLTGGIAVPAYTALVGISEYSLLIASGFTGTAITMAIGAVCHRFSLVYSATGTNAIGIDARFAAAVVDNVNVDMWGASGSNTAIYAGAAET